MTFLRGKRLQVILPLLILAAATGFRIADPILLEEFRLRIFDNYQRLEPRAYQAAPVVVIDLDEETLKRHGQWPWPRNKVAELAQRLSDRGAALIGFDIVFSEPDRTSPSRLLAPLADRDASGRIWELIRESGALDHDLQLAETMAALPAATVAGFILTQQDLGAAPMLKAGFATAGDDPVQFLTDFRGATANLAPIDAAATGAGSLNAITDSDGVVRRVPLFVAHRGQIYPSITAEILRVAQGATTFILKSSGASGETAFGEATGIVEVKIGQLVLPTDSGGHVLLHDSGPVPERSIPAWKVFETDAPLPRLEGAIVLIGTSAVGLKDQQTTPLDPNAAGVTVHAQVLEQAFFGDHLYRPDWADGAEILLLAALGLLIVALFGLTRIPTFPATLLSFVLIGAGVAASWVAYTRQDLLLDPVYPGLMGIAVYTSASFLRFVSTERERKQIRTAFGQYMAPALIERLAEDPGQLKLGGEIRPLTLLFCDIRGFTTISEQLDAEALTHLINRFLTPMSNIIMERDGTIDKYMGDCIMAFWNAPLDVPEHGRQGVESALAMRERLILLNSELKLEAAAKNQPEVTLGIGIGLNSGEACVGNVGSEQRFDYSALGDTVNLAARLEGQCKTYGVEIVISESTRDEVPDYAVLELDLITVKGKTVPIRIFTVIGGTEKAGDPIFKTLAVEHREMIAAYRGKSWDKASGHIDAARALASTLDEDLDGLYDLYSERIASFRNDPPAEDWDGVYVSRTK